MKEFIIAVIAIACFSPNVFAQRATIFIDNVNGRGGLTATNLGLFFGANGMPYTGPSINVEVFGGPNADSLSPIAILSGANALYNAGPYTGPGTYADPTASIWYVPGLPASGVATLQVRAWVGPATSYTNATLPNQFWAWDGFSFVSGENFTFLNGTGGDTGGVPKLPQSLDGMPAMLLVPEPSTIALALMGAAAMLIFQCRNPSRHPNRETANPIARRSFGHPE